MTPFARATPWAWLCLALALGSASPAYSQGGGSSSDSLSTPADSLRWRDPTRPSPQLDRALRQAEPKLQGKAFEPVVPKISLRGRVWAKGQEPAALIEVDKEVFLVRPGSSMSAGPLSIRILEISADALTAEISPLGRIMVIR